LVERLGPRLHAGRLLPADGRDHLLEEGLQLVVVAARGRGGDRQERDTAAST
jgi:hypothetical protein